MQHSVQSFVCISQKRLSNRNLNYGFLYSDNKMHSNMVRIELNYGCVTAFHKNSRMTGENAASF